MAVLTILVAPVEGRQDPRAPVSTEYIRISNIFASTDGVLHSQPGQRARVGMVTTHPRSRTNFNTWPCGDLPISGVDMLCFNNRFSNSEAGTELTTMYEQYARDIAAAVQEMRDRGYETVLLFGGSAGGPLMSFYQNVAENGNAVFDPDRTLSGFSGYTRGGNELRLPAADGLIFRAPTMGTSASFLLRLDGAIVDEETGEIDPTLDLYNPDNGFDPETRTATYSEEFLDRYYTAQAERMNRIVASGQQQLEDIAQGLGRFTDDEMVVIPGTRADPAHIDLSVHAETSEPRLLLPEGTTEIVQANRPVRFGERERNRRVAGASPQYIRPMFTYRVLETSGENYNPGAVTIEDSGIDFDSVNSDTPTNIAGVSVPILILAGTADDQVHFPSIELMYNSATSTDDKTLIFVNGATHSFSPVGPEFGDTRRVAEDAMVEWVGERFRIVGGGR